MKVFRNYDDAMESSLAKDTFYLNGACPYSGDYETLCGSWCSLFYLGKATGNLSAHVILGCKAGEKMLYVEEIVGE